MSGASEGSHRKVALVTGGVARIGRAICERLAADGYAVAVHVRQETPDCREAMRSIADGGGLVTIVDGDLATLSAVETLLPRVCARFGPVTLLVNNASRFYPDEVNSLTEESWNAHFAVNLRAPAFLMRDLARHLPPDRTGSIVNIIDQRVWRLTPLFTSYTIAKAALWTATQTFAQALAPRIRVNAVGPGPTLPNVRQNLDDFARQSASVLLGKGGSPADIAEAVLYLANSESITGQMIAVDGGQHLAWQTPDVYGIAE
jgi:NAD(P)-dependent dehydrogenase (short-subunit alcohol dehydrogenase family)